MFLNHCFVHLKRSILFYFEMLNIYLIMIEMIS